MQLTNETRFLFKKSCFLIIFALFFLKDVQISAAETEPLAEKRKPSISNYLSLASEKGKFLQSYISNPTRLGAVAASSEALTTKIIKYVKVPKVVKGPMRILEVGAGDGAFTKRLASLLKEEDLLDVIELEPIFCKKLEDTFKSRNNIHIHCISIVDWKPSYRYHRIVSGLPFNAFPSQLVKDILSHYEKNLIEPYGILSYFEYIGLHRFQKSYLRLKSNIKFKDFVAQRETTQSIRNRSEFDRDAVVANFPPAWVHHLQFD